jgi:hypothetical protein
LISTKSYRQHHPHVGRRKRPVSELKIALMRTLNGLTLPNATAFIRSSASQPK